MSDTIWTYRTDVYRPDTDLQGFDVEATDGGIGSVDETVTNRDHLVVDTGFWIFGKKRLLPVGVINSIDYEAEKVYVDMTKDEIKNAPDYDEAVDRTSNDWDRDPYSGYYGSYLG